jgi:hypothetical protein
MEAHKATIYNDVIGKYDQVWGALRILV